MIKDLIQKIVMTTLFGWIFMAASFAQGTYGDDPHFNYKHSSVADWTGFKTSPFTTTLISDGDILKFELATDTNSTRSKTENSVTHKGAVKCKAIELPEYASLGYLSCYVQNGSGSTTHDISVKVWNGANWITVETISLGGNEAKRFTPTAALSKKNVKVRIEATTAFWFYQLEAWSHISASTDVNEAPLMLSSNPAASTDIPSSGTINIQFDEIVKLGTGSITFGAATVTAVFLGNTLQLNYSGLTGSSNTLVIPAGFVQNNGNINLATGISITFSGDITDPTFVSVSPVDGANIVIRDVLQKIILTFDDNIALGTGSISISPAIASAVFTPSVSGKTLVIGYSGLAYSTAYTITIPANMIADISGNTFKSAINLNYTTLPKDLTAPLLSSKSVADAATNIPIGGSLYFIFNEEMELGTGNATLGGNPVTLSINKFMVGINYTNLDYSTTYTVSIPSGVLTDTTGNAYSGTTFSFTTQARLPNDFDIIVAKDGSGDYTTIQAAINAVTTSPTERKFIFVKSGIYNEKVLIPTAKQNISLIGQDSSNTIITYNDPATVLGTDGSYTMNVQAPGFYAENFKIKNEYGQGSQAVALMTEGDRQVYKNCRMYGFQDTHYPKRPDTRNYYLNCYIEGATDFMFGSGTCFFEGCIINCVSGGQFITAPSGTTKEFGLVYNNCIIKANSNVSSGAYFLGRPWKDYAKTVWLNTKMGPHVKDIGWSVWATSGDDADNHLTGFFAEYNSMDLLGALINPTRAAWGVKLTAPQSARYTIDNVFNFGAGANAFNNTWNPLPFSTAPNAPANLVNNVGTLTWDATPFAVAYVIFKDGVPSATLTNTTYTPAASGTFNYSVKAVNEYGAQSLASTPVSITAINVGNLSKIGVELYPNPFAETITIQNSEKVKSIEFYNVDGKLVKQATAGPTVKTADMESGTYILKLTDFNGTIYSLKMIKR